MKHVEQSHYFFHLCPELLPFPRQWCEPDHRAASRIYSYEAYRYLLDLLSLKDVSLFFSALLCSKCVYAISSSNARLLFCFQVKLHPFEHLAGWTGHH